MGGRGLPHWQSHQGGITFYLFRQSVLGHMHFRSHLDLEYLKVARTQLKRHYANPLGANPVAELLKGCGALAKGKVAQGRHIAFSLGCSACCACLAVSSGFIWSSSRRRLGRVDWQCMSEFLALIQHTQTHRHTHTCTLYIYINILLHLYELIIKFQ